MNNQTENRKPIIRSQTQTHTLKCTSFIFYMKCIQLFFWIYRFPLKIRNIFSLSGFVDVMNMPKQKMIHYICDERQTILSINLLKLTKNLERQWSMFHRKYYRISVWLDWYSHIILEIGPATNNSIINLQTKLVQMFIVHEFWQVEVLSKTFQHDLFISFWF